MRIIKEGKLPPKEKEMTCPECGCVFMYDDHRLAFRGDIIVEKDPDLFKSI